MHYTKVSKLILNNGENLDLNPNDIVVFVGPNNAGKSQALRDIYHSFERNPHTVVVNDIGIEKCTYEEFEKEFKSNSFFQESNRNYCGLDYSAHESHLMLYRDQEKLMNAFLRYHVAYLDTERRLSIANPPSAIDRNEPKTHPIHYLLCDKDYRDKISSYFSQAFGDDLSPDFSAHKSVPLCIGPIPQVGNSDASVAYEEMEKAYAKYPQVHQQGDGIRCFTGIILNLIMKNYGVYLIDEPESFLHPPQAKIMGNVIAEMLGNDRQAFISTHSSELIKGLLDKCPERIKIIRITRDKDTNFFSALNNDKFVEIWGDSLLKHSNIMDSLFHKNVVVCESDSDCRFYSVVLDNILSKQGHYMETLFVPCGSKVRLKNVVSALRSLSIDFRCVPDIDIFSDENTLRSLLESAGVVWDEDLAKHYKIFASGLEDRKTKKEDVKADILAEFDRIEGDTLSRAQVKKLREVIKSENKWDLLKKGGESVIPPAEATKACKQIVEILNKANIYVVPVG